jgi:predicted  nucleic acid-binding Zn-ribbon protein
MVFGLQPGPLQQDLERHDSRLASLHDESDTLNGSLRDMENAAGTAEERLQEQIAAAGETRQALAQEQGTYR